VELERRPDDDVAREILVQTRERLETGWCQGADARDGAGAAVDPWSDRARSWSLLGALVAVTDPLAPLGNARLGALRRALAALAEFVVEPSLAEWNDAEARTHANVISVLDEALRYLGRPVPSEEGR
jgi:hypothetical protein